MEFRIADTFTDSLSKLSQAEQTAVKTAAFDLQLNLATPGMQFHRIEKAKDPRFWSVRVNLDIRLIVHKSDTSLMLCYAGHHDHAYHWAARRKLEAHPKTGAAQWVEIRETVREVMTPRYVTTGQPAPGGPFLFANMTDDQLLSVGVPEEWLDDVRHVNEDTLLELADHLPGEAAEALLNLATGETPKAVRSVPNDVDPFDHPDAQRRFRVMNNMEELKHALEYPWEKWAIFLHPEQQHLIERDYNGPVRISGSAGTGKTIVALHRAVFLARANPAARVLLTTFSEPLANVLRTRLRQLICHEPRIAERLDVKAMDAIGRRLFEMNLGRPDVADRDVVRQLLKVASEKVDGQKFSLHFLMNEWEEVVDAWQLASWEAYRDIRRLGRKTRLSEKHRIVLWSIFEQVQASLKSLGLITAAAVFSRMAVQLIQNRQTPFDFVVVDEAQDITVSQLRFLAALGGSRPDGLFFAGDLGQRIFQQPFSWKALGIDIRGRSRTLRINYRTSHQIRMQADRLLGPELSDVDGNSEERTGTISLFNGPNPVIRVLNSRELEINTVGKWLLDRMNDGIMPHETSVFVRSPAELDRAGEAVKSAGLKFSILDESVETTSGNVSISTMHYAKGLEFRAVAVMACDDEVIPLQSRIETVSDFTDLEEIYNTERHLLYIACTRARDHLLVTGVDPASEFLDDLKM